MRKNILALSLFEAAKTLKERAEPAAAAPAPSGDVPTDEETGEAITLDHILGRFNTVRSGKSFQDPEVYGKLTTIFKSMSPDEKIKLNQQLRNIGAVVQNQIPVDMATKAETPAPTAEPAPEPTPPTPAATPAPTPPAA